MSEIDDALAAAMADREANAQQHEALMQEIDDSQQD